MSGGAVSILAWLALGVAFSPVVGGMLRDLPPDGAQPTPLVAAVLLIAIARREAAATAGASLQSRPSRPSGPSGRSGSSEPSGPSDPSAASGRSARLRALGLLAIGLGLELLGLATDAATLACAGLPFAVIGLAGWLGAPRLPVALLAIWLVPLPVSLLAVTSPELESLWARLAAGLLRAFGLDLEGGGSLLRASGAVLSLSAAEGGATCAHLLACLGWYRGLVPGADWRPPLWSALRWALAAPLVQLGATLLALVLLDARGREAALLGLRLIPVLIAVAVALLWPRRGVAR